MPRSRNPVVEVVIRAKDATAQVVGRFRRRWRSLERTVRDVSRAVLAFTAAGAAAVFGLQRLGAQGDKVLAVQRAFQRITIGSANALEELRAAAQGAISDFRLMALANQALTLGAVDTVEQFSEMVRLSRILGRAQGVDALSALESFTIGLARQSPRILDNIGLTIKLGDTTTFAARALDLARQKAEELAGAGGVAASTTERFGTAMANLRDRLSEVVATSPLVDQFFEGLIGLTEDIIDLLAGDSDQLVEGVKTLGRLAGDAFSIGVNEAIEAFVDKGNPLGRAVARFFGGNADVARGNLAANREALASIARSAQARAAARRAAGGGSGGGAPSAVAGPTLPGVAPRDFTGFGVFGLEAFRARQAQIARDRAQFGFGIPGEGIGPLRGTRGSVPGSDEANRAIDETGEGLEELADAGAIAVAGLGSATEAIIRGSGQIEQSLVAMVTNILRALPGVGGFAGAVIGAVGGIAGALLGRRGRPEVVVHDIRDQAAEKLRRNTDQPIRVTTIVEQGGVEIERIEKEFADRSQRDEVVRYSPRSGLALRGP